MKSVFVIFTRTISTGEHRNIIGVLSTKEKADKYLEKNKKEFNRNGIGIYYSELQVDSMLDLV